MKYDINKINESKRYDYFGKNNIFGRELGKVPLFKNIITSYEIMLSYFAKMFLGNSWNGFISFVFSDVEGEYKDINPIIKKELSKYKIDFKKYVSDLVKTSNATTYINSRNQVFEVYINLSQALNIHKVWDYDFDKDPTTSLYQIGCTSFHEVQEVLLCDLDYAQEVTMNGKTKIIVNYNLEDHFKHLAIITYEKTVYPILFEKFIKEEIGYVEE